MCRGADACGMWAGEERDAVAWAVAARTAAMGVTLAVTATAAGEGVGATYATAQGAERAGVA
eukprot:3142368-Prymnesium_polylepis.1